MKRRSKEDYLDDFDYRRGRCPKCGRIIYGDAELICHMCGWSEGDDSESEKHEATEW